MTHSHHGHEHEHDHTHMTMTLIAYFIGLMLFGIGFLLADEFWKHIIFILVTVLSGYHVILEGLIDTVQQSRVEKAFRPNAHFLMFLAAVAAIAIGQHEEAALLILIFAGSHFLEDYAESKSRKSMTDLLSMQPKHARLLKENDIIIVDIDHVKVGDTLQVLEGDHVALDGVITSGLAVLNEATINGESIPKEKTIDEEVYASTLNVGGQFLMTVTKSTDDTVFAKIIQMVEQAQTQQTKTATAIKKFEPRYVVGALIFILAFFIFSPFLFGWSYDISLYKSVVLLVCMSPCALAASAVPATLSAISNLSKKGILIKGGYYLSLMADLKSIAFDKTGTLTSGAPKVTDTFFLSDEDHLPSIIKSMEQQSNHPLATAIVSHYNDHPTIDMEVKTILGTGLIGEYAGFTYQIAKPSAYHSISSDLNDLKNQWESEGKTVVLIAKNDAVIGGIALMDVPRGDAIEMIRYFNEQGIKTSMITGDAKQTGEFIGKQVGVKEVFAEVMPQHKAEIVSRIKSHEGITAMVGDGVNDAPSLATADIGMAMGQGTDIAIDVADVVLLKNELTQLTYLHRLSKRLNRIVWQNVAFSMAVVCILVMMNVFDMSNIAFSVIGHEGSTILVILNGLRLLIPLHDIKE